MRIAVYGTLRKGGGLHYLLSEQKFIGKTKVKGYKIAYDYLPKAVPSNDEIVVEVYDVHDDIFKVLDKIERGAGYEAELVDTEFGGVVMWVWRKEVNGAIFVNDYIKEVLLA